MEPNDAPKGKLEKKKISANNIEDVTAPGALTRGTSFVVPMDDEKPLKPKPKHLQRLEEGQNSPKLSKADLEAKQRKAEQNKKSQLAAKTEFAKEDANKRAEIVSNSAKGKKAAAKAISAKLNKAGANRDGELSAKKKAGQQSSVKGKKARARRLDDALQAGKDGTIEGDDDGESSDEDEVEM